MPKKGLVGILIAVIIVVLIILMILPHRPSGLLSTVQNVRYSSACDRMVPMRGIAGYPIPIKTSQGELAYQVFFFGLNPSYPAQSPGQEPKLIGPSIVAELRADGTAECSRMMFDPSMKFAADYGPRFSAEANKLSLGAFDSRKNDLYLATEKVAKKYFANETGEGAKSAALDFWDQFSYLSEPGFKQFYYNLNPDFWQWVEKITGRIFFPAPAATAAATLSGINKVPQKARGFLPSSGILLVSGGLTSYASRAVVDLNKQTVTFARAKAKGGSSYAVMDTSAAAPLTQAQINKIVTWRDEILSARENFAAERPMLDFDVVVFLVKDGAVKVINSFGPPVGPVNDLYYYVWGLMPAIK